MTRLQFTESKYNFLKIQKGSRLFCTDKMTDQNIQNNKINNIYLRGWQRYCNPLKYIVNLGFARKKGTTIIKFLLDCINWKLNFSTSHLQSYSPFLINFKCFSVSTNHMYLRWIMGCNFIMNLMYKIRHILFQNVFFTAVYFEFSSLNLNGLVGYCHRRFIHFFLYMFKYNMVF
jgi:hypothetical protein